MSDQPIVIHYQQMEEWLSDRKSVFERKFRKPYHVLLEVAPRLVQLIKYDIPALQKQIKKTESTLDECERVCVDADRIQANRAQKRLDLLSEYGLLRHLLDKSDRDMVQHALDARIDESCLSLMNCLRLYAKKHLTLFRENYVDFLSKHAPEHFPPGVFDAHFPWLSYLEKGHSLPLPDHIGRVGDDTRGAEGDAIEGEAQIIWEDAFLPLDGTTVEITWNAADEKVAARSDNDGELPIYDGKYFYLDIARGLDRANILNELHASCCFASERVNEGGHTFYGFIAATKELIQQLASSTDAELMRMKHSFRLKEEFLSQISLFDRSIAAAQARKQAHEQKIVESRQELLKLEPQLNFLLERAKSDRDLCLQNLQSMFPGRQITMVGDINKYI
ncbi:unnamed protein product [Phytomonas sp. EM1]|nr:unnamed protein product [Phytomonas sp. EM1]|eukprot:CCW61494.1 unnamed protein product [Phytomonas sp. isolate EM1]